MTTTRFLDDDIVHVYEFGKPQDEDHQLATLFWGDQVKVVDKVGENWKLDFDRWEWNSALGHSEWKHYDAVISNKAKFRETSVLKVRFVDVGQGDAVIIETPLGKLLLLDGGEEENLKNYMRRAWAYILRTKPIPVEAIIVTHGDADHFAGLVKLMKAKRSSNQPVIIPKRVFHSGLVKGSSALADKKIFGETKMKDEKLFIVDLADDLRAIPDERMNQPFRSWKAELIRAAEANPTLTIHRLAYGDSAQFDFLNTEGIQIQVLGPIVTNLDGTPALPFLHNEKNAYSAAQTINGHSVVLKLTYGNVRFLFGADVNRESETGLLAQVQKDGISLESEILKVPHHGSADFDPAMLKAVRAVVSVISSGDENESREYIHPRSGLVGALGKYSRSSVEKPLVYVTEMVAFFKRIGLATIQANENNKPKGEPFTNPNTYYKQQFGIVHVRTDGKRVLVACHSGKPGMKESYSFNVSPSGKVKFEDETSVI